MPFKKIIQVSPPEPNQYTKLRTSAGSDCWGHVEITKGPMPSGPIHFQYGRANANAEGWGLKHVWKKRHQHHPTHEAALIAIEPLVLAVLSSGTGVWFEEDGKVAAVSSRNGTVILRLHPDGVRLSDEYDWWYSITSFFPRTSPHGLRVGAIR